MIITIDGYDGTGKTTLAKKLAKKYNFKYMDKPFIKKYEIENLCSNEEARIQISKIERRLFASALKTEIAGFYCEALYWLSQFKDDYNIVLDRGLLTIYAVVGDSETENVFKKYIEMGAFLDSSIYLKADDEERVRRIYNNDPNDPDLKYPVKWRENNLEEFAQYMNLNYHTIDTNNKNEYEVFEIACLFFEQEIAHFKRKEDNNDYYKKIKEKV